MSHFEYVSVATALIFALAVGRLLGGLWPAMDGYRRYWVHLAWVVVLLLYSVLAWWLMWRMHEVIWTPLLFLWALMLPALIFVQATVLLGTSETTPTSYYDHFYDIRSLFFVIGLITTVSVMLTPWVFEITPWWTLSAIHPYAAIFLVLSLTGICSPKPAVHPVLVVSGLIIMALGFFLIPLPTTGL